MIRNWRTASATAGFTSVSPILATPFAPSGGGAIAAALLRSRQLFQALKRERRRPPRGPDGPEKPDGEEPTPRSILNDPHFWMLLVH
jgi:hypothetical protein